MRRLLVLVCVASCWTGSSAPPAETTLAHREEADHARPSERWRVRLERTTCMGDCPSYVVEIDRDGRVRYEGRAGVALTGIASGRASERGIQSIVRELERIKFFERNEYGQFEVKPECTSDGTTTTCTLGASFSFCTDTPHLIITVTRGATKHTINYDHCNENPEVLGLGQLIDRVANTDRWVTR